MENIITSLIFLFIMCAIVYVINWAKNPTILIKTNNLNILDENHS